MSFLQKTYINIFNAIDNSEGKSIPDILHIIQTLLKIDEDGNVEDEIFKDILGEVVYFVINSTDMKSPDRTFIAGLNWDNLSSEVGGEFLLPASLNINSFGNEDKSGSFLFSLRKRGFECCDAKTKDIINTQWNIVWQEYFDITQNGENNEEKLLTLNQMLLKYAENPLNIGFYWGEKCRKVAAKNYHHLSKNKLKQLGLIKEPWLNNDKDNGKLTNTKYIKEIKEKFDSMKLTNISLLNDFNIEFCIYHLLRSYGCWGGNAFYSIPINYGKGRYSGVLSICTTKPMNTEMIWKWTLIANKFFRDFSLNELHKHEEYAIRAAISQVMARNMSHNIGSHVLSRIDEVFFEKLLTSNVWKSNFYKPLDVQQNNDQSNIQLLATFNSYQKSLMDFLADITFGEPTMEVTKMLFNEVLAGIDKNRIMLEFVSGDNYKFRFVARNTTCCSFVDKNMSFDFCGCVISESEFDIAVSIPNDILGCHAFYLILTNLIRNSAKHGGNKNNDINEIYIDVSGCDSEDFYEVRIYDSSVFGAETLKKLVRLMNIKLSSSLIENGKLRQGSWGLIEMAAAAAYLRKEPLENINNEEYRPINSGKRKKKPFLEAIGYNNNFGYKLFLNKPKELLLVLNKSIYNNANSRNRLNELCRSGILIKVLDNDDTNMPLEGKKYPYPIMLFVGSEADYVTYVKTNENNLPIRKLVYFTDSNDIKSSRFTQLLSSVDFSINDFLENTDTTPMLNLIWDLWVQKTCNFTGIVFSRYFVNSTLNENIILDKQLNSVFQFDGRPKTISFGDHSLEGCSGIINNKRKYFYAEPYNSKDYYILRKIFKNSKKPFLQEFDNKDFPLLCKLIEGIYTTVFIVDERIQELAEQKTYSEEGANIKWIDLLYCTNVIVPRTIHSTNSKINNKKCFNLNESDFSLIKGTIISFLKTAIKQNGENNFNKNKADFLLIHLGIIEKLIKAEGEKWQYGKGKDGIEKYIRNVILMGNETSDTRIIIISGRGKPSNLPDNFLFLNFSMVTQYCFEARLKLLLSNLVYSSKPL